MKLYALTYTDPSEPWGYAIEGRKLYRTPSEVVDAANAHFDNWCTEIIWKDGGTRTTGAIEAMATWPLNYEGMTLEEVMVDEWSREYRFGLYEV